ncbi:MAG: hypothetical protein HFH68_15970 [Lachnospiraceae bacterium]|nr:hypothetical protein [Lachnospiraceae bacterium]
MKKLKEQPLKLPALVLAVLLGLSVTGCSKMDYSATKDQGTVSSDCPPDVKNTPSAVPGLDTPDGNLDDGNNVDSDSIDTSISSGYYLSLGVLDENVVRNGAGRNESDVSVIGKKIIFPQGGIRSISIKSWPRQEKPYNPPKPGIIQYVDALESAVIVDSVPENVLEKMVKIDTHILYLNSHGEFRTINIVNFGNGYHEISVEKDDAKNFAKKIYIKSGTGKKYHHVFLRSMEAENIIKKWIHWEKQGKNGFGFVQSASLFYDGNPDGIKLSEDHLKKIKIYLEKCKKTDGAPCGYENYFECIQDNGDLFHFSISADGESISTDKSVYIVDYPDSERIAELLKEIRKSSPYNYE